MAMNKIVYHPTWLAFFLLVICLLAYQKIATLIDDYRFPPIGEIVNIEKQRFHIHSSGIGGPTVILDAGLSGTSLGWALVQEKVSLFTRVCSYDRAGYAWSETSKEKRTSEQLAKELHALLQAAHIPAPYILVGHSFGGCNVLVFADMYPDETVGVVLVDSVQENML